MSELFDDLKKVQESVNKLQKSSDNPFFKSKYADLNQVLEVVKPVLHKNNFVLLQLPQHRDNKNLLKTILLHSSGEKVEGEIELVCKDASDPQKLGGAITYMRRYSIIAMLGLEQEDDDANSASTKETNTTQQKTYGKPAIEKWTEEVKELYPYVSWSVILKKYSVKKLSDLTEEQKAEILKDGV